MKTSFTFSSYLKSESKSTPLNIHTKFKGLFDVFLANSLQNIGLLFPTNTVRDNLQIGSNYRTPTPSNNKGVFLPIINIDDGVHFREPPPTHYKNVINSSLLAPYKYISKLKSEFMYQFSEFPPVPIRTPEKITANRPNPLRWATALLMMFAVMLSSFAQAQISVDVVLKDSIDNSRPIVGGTVNYYVMVKNQGASAVSNVMVKNTFPVSGATLTGNAATMGTFTSGTGTWAIPSIPAGGMAKLTLTGTVIAQGVYFNISEIMSIAGSTTNNNAGDSGNGKLGEADMGTACFSVPLLWEAGDEYTVSLASVGLTNITWSKVTTTGSKAVTGIASDSASVSNGVLTITGTGRFAFSGSINTCPANGCCEVIVIPAPIFDLALTKTLVGTATVTPGDIVTFKLEIENQGVVTAKNILLSDSLPAGMTLADPNWTAIGNIATMNTAIAGPLAPGAKTSVTIMVKVDATVTAPITLTNYAQIKSDEDDKGNKNPTDRDSQPGSGFNKGQDDDSKAPVNVVPKDVYDLALLKTLVGPNTVQPGDVVTFKLDVTNEGNVTAKNIVLSDSLPVGLTLADPNWTAVGRIATMNTAIAGPLAPGATTSVTIMVKIDPSLTAITLTNYAQIKSDEDDKGNKNPTDKDSQPGSGFNKGQDDDSKAPINVNPLPLGSIGDYVWIDANDNGIQDAGEKPVKGVKVTLWSNNAGVPGSIITTATTDINGLYLFSGLNGGGYFVQFDPLTLPDSLNLSNKPNTGSDASDSDADPATGFTQLVTLNPILGGILKDNPTLDAGVTVFNLGLNKTLTTAGVVKAGDVVTFKLTVTNKGSQTASAIMLSDSLPVGMTLADANWTAAGQIATMNTAIPGTLAPGASVSVNIMVKIDANFTGTSLTNYAQIKDAKDDKGKPRKDVNSTPGNGFKKGEDDDSSAPVRLSPEFDLALAKTLTTTGTVKAGDIVTFKLTVTNQGDIPATKVILSDSLPVGMTLADANWTAAGQIATLNTAIAGPIAPGASASVNIMVKIDANFTGTSLTNYAQIKSTEDDKGNVNPKDRDSTPGNGFKKGEDDDSSAPVRLSPEFDLALAKTLTTTGTVKAGDIVTFKLTVTNQGDIAATKVALTDSLPVGMTLADANWTAAGQIATLNTAIAGPIAPGASASVNIMVKIDANFTGTSLTNYAQIKSTEDDKGNVNPKDRDSTPGNGFKKGEDDDSSAPVRLSPEFDLALAKTLTTTGTVKAGDIVTFKLTVTNQGDIAATKVALTDSLPVGMTLADANWTAAGQIATLNTPIAGPIAPGASASVNIMVKIDAGFTGTTLMNYAQIKDAKDGQGNPVKDRDSTPGNGFNKGEDDDSKAPVSLAPCVIPPTPTCAGVISNVCPSECVNLNDPANLFSTPRSELGVFEWHSGSTPTAANLIADPTCVKVSGKYFLFEKSVCGIYSNGALAEVVIKECPKSDLSLTKTVSNKTPNKDENITYTIKVKNAGPATATNVEVSDKLPTGLSYVSGGAGVTQAAGVITGKVASIVKGDSATFTFVAKVTGSGTITNFAEVSKSDQPDPNSTPGNGVNKGEDDDDSVPITVREKCDIPPTPTCAGTITNICPAVCVNLNDPKNLLSSPRSVGGILEWHTSPSPTAANLIADPTCVKVSGKYFLFEKAACGEYSNGALAEVVIVPCAPQVADLSLTKTVNKTSVSIGDTVKYTITVKNAGPDAATKVEVLDKLPAGLSYVSGGAGVTQAAGMVTGKAASIAKGASATFTYMAKVTEAGSIKNMAEVSKSDQNDPNSDPGNAGTKHEDDDDAVTIESKDPNCAIPPTPTCGGPRVVPCPTDGCVNINLFIQSTIRTKGGVHEWHTGPSPSSPIVTDPTCVKVGGSYYVFEKAACGEYSNAALLMLTIEPCGPSKIDVSLAMAISNSSPSVGDEVTYTITVSNATGMATATNVKVTDLLPAGIQFVSSTDFTASRSTLTSNNIPSIPAGGSVVLTFKAKVTADGSLVNKAQVSAHDQIDVDSAKDNGYDNGEDDRASITVETKRICDLKPLVLACSKPDLCPGESTLITVTANGCEGGTISWSNGLTGSSITVTPSITTGYTAICTKGGCVSGISNTITVSVATPAVPTVLASTTTVCAGGTATLTASGCSGTTMWSNGVVGVQIMVSPTATTTYTAMCKIGNCMSANSTPVTITIGNPSAPTISASPKTLLCAGETVNLTATGCEGGSVVWSNGTVGASITVSPMATTEYTAKCKIADCMSAASNTVKITVNTTGTPPVVTAPKSNICTGESVTLSASGCEGGTITWSTGATGSSISVSPTTTTTYSASCKGATGKCDSAPGSITVSVGNNTQPVTITASPSGTVCAGGSVTLTATGCTGGTITWSTGAVGSSIVVTPSATTSYTATCKIGVCESVPATTTVTVTPRPTRPDVTCSTENLCPGESVTLEVKNCVGTVVWSTGAVGVTAIAVTPTVTTAYTAICKVGNCESEVSKNYTITVTPVTVPTLTASKSSITKGETVKLTAVGCNGEVIWSNGMTGAEILVSPQTSTSYTAICKKGVCTSAASTPVSVTVTGNPVCTTPSATPTVSANPTSITSGGTSTLTASGCVGGTVTWSNGMAGASITVSPTSTTSYTATCKVGDCPASPASAPVSVTVIGNPVCTTPSATPTVSANPTSITSGGTSTLTASGCVGGTVTWSNGMAGASITVSPTSTTSYTATCKVGDCPASPASAPVSVTVTPKDPTACAAPVIAGGTSICNGGSAILTASGCEGGAITWSNGMTGTSITVNPTSSTTYTASCKKADCTGSAASNGVTVTVNTANPPTVVCSATAICKGGSVAISANGCAGTVTWNNAQIGSSINVSPETSTTYTAKCKVGNCESVASTNCVITVTTPVAPTIKASASKVCYGSQVTLSADGNCNGYFTWSNGLVGNSITITPTANTTYTAVCCTSTNCKSGLSNAVSVEVGTKVAKPEVKDLTNACPFKKVDLTQGITSTAPAGTIVEFHIANDENSAVVANPTAIETSGTYYAFYRSGSCASAGSAITVMITPCNDTPDCEKNPATANAGPNSSICAALSYKLSGKIGGIATGATWTTNGPGKFSNALALDATYYPTIEEIIKGSTILTLTTNDPDGSGSCKAGVSSMTLTFEGIKIRPQMMINGIAKADTLPATMNICSMDSIVLEAQETGYDYKWFKNGVIVPAFANMKKIVVKESGTYSYGLVDAKRCCSVASARVTINIPTVPSPTKLTGTNVCPATVIDLTKSLSQGTDMNAIVFKTSMSASGQTVANPTQASAGTYYVYSKTGNCSVLQSVITATLTTCGTIPPVDTTKAKPAIGVALAVKGSVKQADGSYNVSYLITISNVGNTPLTNVQVKDSIGTQIKAPATYTVVGVPVLPNGSTSSLVINSSYNGTSNLNILGTGSTLGVGQTETVVIVYNVIPNGGTTPIPANVVASGSAGTVVVADVSNTGTKVNPPSSTSTTVRFDLPTSLMGLSKSVGTPTSLGGNKYKIPYTIQVSNVGTADLKKVQVMDDLAQTFGSKAVIIGKPVVLADSGFVVDTNYTGQGMMTKLLIDSLSNLSKGTSRTIRLMVTIAATNVDSSTVFNNIAIGKAMAGSVMISDTSTTGNNVDPDNDLDPRNNSKPTPVVLNSLPGRGLIGSALSIKDTLIQGDGSMNITYRVRIKNFGSKAVGNVQLKDSLSKVFNSLTGATFTVIGTPIANDSSELRINPDFDGVRDMNLLIAEQSRLSAGKLDSVFFTINVKTDGRLTPYLNQICARAISGSDTLIDLSMNGLDSDPNGNNDPTELTEAELTPVVIRAEGGELYIPEGFSPNGDGINDLFIIRHPAGTKVVVEIYNRWMHQVYRNEDYLNDWDGSSNVSGQSAQGLPVGTYYYNVVMQDANGSETKRVCRFMTINR
jgi:large repetitive protein